MNFEGETRKPNSDTAMCNQTLKIITTKVIGGLSIVTILIAILAFAISWFFDGFGSAVAIGLIVLCCTGLLEITFTRYRNQFENSKKIAIETQDRDQQEFFKTITNDSVNSKCPIGLENLNPISFTEFGLTFHGYRVIGQFSIYTWVRGPICPKCSIPTQWNKSIIFPWAFKCTCPCGFKKYFFKGTPESIYSHAKSKWEIEEIKTF